jgi:UDPglucose 6-dehydrogenase
MAHEADLHPQLLEAVMQINQDQRHVVIDKLADELKGSGGIAGKSIAVLGLAFKDNTDDMRDAAAIDIINWLIEARADVRVFDPVATPTAKRLFPDWEVTYCADEYDAVDGCDGVLVVTEWKRFRDLNMTRLHEKMHATDSGPVLIDGRNLFDAAELNRIGFRYHGIGRGEARTNGTRRVDTATGQAPQSEKNGREQKSTRRAK